MPQLVCQIHFPKSKSAKLEDDKHPHMIKNKQELSNVVIKLEIVKQPSPFLLLNEWFDVEFSIAIDLLGKVAVSELSEQNSDAALGVKTCIELSAILLPCEDSRSNKIGSSEYKLVVDTSSSSTILFSEQAAAKSSSKFRCKMVGPATLKNNSPNIFSIDIFNSNKVSLGELKKICTEPFNLVSYKLVLEKSDFDDRWYKDEGGRDKCMQVEIGLYSSKGLPVYGHRVNLKFALLYDTHAPHSKVLKQDILQVLGPITHFIDPKTSKATVRFRIEDVSKNHQGQNFKIQISADPTKVNHVAPICSPSVSVRSKRNKKQRTSKIDTSSSPHNSSSFITSPVQSPHLSTNPPVSSPQIILGKPGYLNSSTDRELISQGLDRVRDVTRLREAMRGVIGWTEEVVNGLYSLQWQIVGYAQFPDGQLNYNCPYHSMPNPNECISKILSMYADPVRDQLKVLLNAVENTQDNQELVQPVEVNSSGSGDSIQYQHPLNNPESNTPFSFRQDSSHSKVQGFHPKYSFKAPPMASSSSASTQFPLPAHDMIRGRTNVNGHGDQWHDHHQMNISHRASSSNRGQITPMASSHSGHRYSRDIQHDSVNSEMQKSNMEVDDLQEEVYFIVAIQYLSPMNGSPLGFPAYRMSKEILGFYRESSINAGEKSFVPISRLEHEFGPMEKLHATHFFTETMQRNRDAVYSIEEWGTVSNLVDHAMVYDWNNIPPDDMIIPCARKADSV